MWRHEWLLHLEIHAVGSKEEAFKIRSHCWNAGFNSRVILLVGMSQGATRCCLLKRQDAANQLVGCILPAHQTGASGNSSSTWTSVGPRTCKATAATDACQIAMTPSPTQHLALASGTCGLTAFQGNDHPGQHRNSKIGSSSCKVAMGNCDYLVQCHDVTPGVTPKSCRNTHTNLNSTNIRRQLQGNLNCHTVQYGTELLHL